MLLHILGSSSSGNCYLLRGESETLVIEAGVRFSDVKKALNFDIACIAGCIVSHEHNDHAKYFNDYLRAGIKVYASIGTVSVLKNVNPINAPVVFFHGKKTKIGQFEVTPFDIVHDAEQPLGFVIKHPEMGKTLFITDTYYCEYTFKGLNHIMVEANYCPHIVRSKVDQGILEPSIIPRLESSHMSIDICKQLLASNDLSQVQDIVLLHLSSSNSDANRFKSEVETQTGKPTYVADKNVRIDFYKQDYEKKIHYS